MTYPRPADADLEEVHCALSVGATLWSRGDETEALKWLRRAAEAAADCDADLRAVELFKAAADIATQLENDETEVVSSKKRPEKQSKKTSSRRKYRRGDSSGRHSARGFSEDDQEMTIVRPETALRRALTRIDPGYPDRIDLPDGASSSPIPAAGLPADTQKASFKSPESSSSMDDTTNQNPSGRRKIQRDKRAAPKDSPSIDPSGVHARDEPPKSTRRGISRSRISTPPGTLPALRVALLPIADEGEVRVLFLNPDEEAPKGVTTAMLVATSPDEAEKLHALFETTDAKL